jgi:DinB superfamily
MNLQYFIQRFTNNRGVFESLLRDVNLEQAKWKPTPDKWSMLEVVNHLYDEEREDFRQRLQLTLADPGQAWPAINPREWVTTRGYNDRELVSSLNSFLAERDVSLEWLKQLKNPDWQNANEGPNGILAAGDLLAAWLAHDFLHIRQLARLHWQYTGEVSAPYQTTYGGPWKES